MVQPSDVQPSGLHDTGELLAVPSSAVDERGAGVRDKAMRISSARVLYGVLAAIALVGAALFVVTIRQGSGKASSSPTTVYFGPASTTTIPLEQGAAAIIAAGPEYATQAVTDEDSARTAYQEIMDDFAFYVRTDDIRFMEAALATTDGGFSPTVASFKKLGDENRGFYDDYPYLKHFSIELTQVVSYDAGTNDMEALVTWHALDLAAHPITNQDIAVHVKLGMTHKNITVVDPSTKNASVVSIAVLNNYQILGTTVIK
jgi:hypothetical protein